VKYGILWHQNCGFSDKPESSQMDKNVLRKQFGIILFLSLIFVAGCDKSNDSHGFLKGVISIGPICPVEKIPPDPGCLPTAETYKAYPVSVYSSDGKKIIIQLSPSLEGSYTCEIPAGNYLVILEKPQNNIGGSNLPASISISSRDTTKLNINIDTGIR
jgi:hypothetical protein